MKAMTWLKVGGGVLVTLAAIAAAGTRYAEVTGKEPTEGIRHAIASRIEACSVIQEEQSAKSVCCKKEAKDSSKSEHCCRK